MVIVFAMEKFHEFVYGTRFLAETDHKPLVSLKNKVIGDMTPRLQRLMLRVRRYDVDLVYTPGKLLYFADTLSRAFPKESVTRSEVSEADISAQVHLVKTQIPVSDNMWCRLAEATELDASLNKLKSMVINGNVQLCQINVSIQ